MSLYRATQAPCGRLSHPFPPTSQHLQGQLLAVVSGITSWETLAPVKAGLRPRPALVSPRLPTPTPTLQRLLSAACSERRHGALHRAQVLRGARLPRLPPRQVLSVPGHRVWGCRHTHRSRTGHAQVLGRKHSTPSTSPSLEESGRKLPCSPFSGHNHQKKMFHPTGGRKVPCHSVSASTSLLIAGVSDRKSRRTLSRDAEPA